MRCVRTSRSCPADFRYHKSQVQRTKCHSHLYPRNWRVRRRHARQVNAETKKRTTPPKKTPNATPSPAAKHARRSRKKSEECEEIVVNNKNTIREYTLQNEIKAVGGRTVMRQSDDANLLPQRRVRLSSGLGQAEVQTTQELTHSCEGQMLLLARWGQHGKDVVECRRCRRSWKRVDAQPDTYCAWMCSNCQMDVCVKCLPVVLQLPDPPDNTKKT